MKRHWWIVKGNRQMQQSGRPKRDDFGFPVGGLDVGERVVVRVLSVFSALVLKVVFGEQGSKKKREKHT